MKKQIPTEIAFQQLVEKYDTKWVHSILMRELEIKRPITRIDTPLYEYTTFDERNLPSNKKTFDDTMEKITEFRYYITEIEDNGIVDKTYVFTAYLHRDERENDKDYKDFSIDNCFIALTTYYGKIPANTWGMIEYPESYIRSFKSFQKMYNMLKHEFKRDPNEQLYIIWQTDDPRCMGDYNSEVSDVVDYIGFEDKAMKIYKHYKQNKAWTGHSSFGMTYPQKLTKNLKVGDKVIHHAAKTHPPDEIEQWERQQEQINYGDYPENY